MSSDGTGMLGLDRVRDEVIKFVSAQARNLVSKGGDKLSGVTDKLTEAAGSSKAVPDSAAKVMKGENPAKAVAGGAAKSVKDKVTGGGGGGGDGDGDGGEGGQEPKAEDVKATNIIETIDVGVPLRTCYDHWTEFDQFGVFTKGVSNVDTDEDDPTTSKWKFKLAFSERTIEATIDEQVPDDRIVWRSEGSQGTVAGAISFHELGPNLTRIIAVISYYPSGFLEKTANIWRAQGRRLRLDLKNFQRYVTLAPEDEVEGWRGEIRNGEVVRSHEDAVAEEQGDGGGGAEGEDKGGEGQQQGGNGESRQQGEEGDQGGDGQQTEERTKEKAA